MILKAALMQFLPMVIPGSENGTKKMLGTFVDFRKIMKDKANISIELVDSIEEGWTGVIKTIAYNVSDMSLTPIVLTSKTMGLMQSSKNILFSYYVMMSRRGVVRDDTDLTDHFKKVEPNVWIIFLISLLILSGLSFVDKFTFHTLRQINYWTIIRFLLLQNHFPDISLNSVTALVSHYIFWYNLVCIGVNQLISVSIILKSSGSALNTFDDILKARTILPSIYKQTSLETLLSESENKVVKRVWKTIELNPNECLRIFPSPITKETPGFNPHFYNLLLNRKVVVFEPDHLSPMLLDFYCRKILTMRWHKSPPLDILPLRYVFGFSKKVDQGTIKKVNYLIEGSISSGLFTKWFYDLRYVRKLFNALGKFSVDCVYPNVIKQNNEYIPIKLGNLEYFSTVLFGMLVLCSIILILEFILKYMQKFAIIVIKIG